MAPSTPQTGPSSRLLSMKFMQRGAATAESLPSPSPQESSSKRRKLSHHKSAGSTPTPASADTDLFSHAKIQAAVEELEAKRRAAVERRAAELSDSHWVLDIPVAKGGAARDGAKEKPPLSVVYVGYGEIDRAGSDSDGDGTQDDVRAGRRITGNYKRKEDKEAEEDSGSGSSDSDGDSDEEGEVSSSSNRGSKKSQSSKKKRDKAEKKKKKKEVKLSRLTSISSGGGSGGISQGGGGGGAFNRQPMKCFACSGVGHKSSDCPKNKARKRRRAAPY
ncbi:hypothetical protein SAPIO_CDS5365 [Scedosporium apiospermum]|uniref:CCHC-type domain-containing protein n=1 Tax=Pseudallescheria apiosperma TaxID=563466 RepID=A0A084G6G0_PSEDA|nr:uncharacterized protein SAPIO_CDS5365 [Scedosporium apiospermum]KEZ42922.1 hypothetical protein SAPIO_CDS5365 [Scedosporium apiospermum]